MFHFSLKTSRLWLTAGGAIVSVWLFSGAYASAEQVIIPLPDRAAVVERALSDHPQLRAARWAVERARGRVEQSGRLANPEIGVRGMTDAPFGNEGEYSFGVSLSQAFPLAARLRHERHASEAQLLAVEAEVAQQRQVIALQTVELWRQAVASAARVRLLREQEALAVRFGEFVRQAASTGERSLLDADLADLELLALRTRIRQEEREGAQVLAELKMQLGITEEMSLELPAPEPLPLVNPLEQWRRVDIDALPAVRGAAASFTAAQAELRRTRAERYGDVTVSVEFEQGRSEDVPVGLRLERFIGLSVSVPLPVWNDYSGNVLESFAASREAGDRLDAERFIARQSVQALGSQVRAAYVAGTDLQDGLLVALRNSVGRVQKGWESGEVGLAELLRARASLVEAELEALRVVINFHLALDRYTAAAGQLIANQ